MKDISLSFLRECFDYDPTTGSITWKQRPIKHFKNENGWKAFNAARAGKSTGNKVALNGYLMLTVTIDSRYRFFYAHRVAWALHHGRMPEFEIDHVNGVRTDNRISNLRAATRLQQAANSVFKGQKNRGVRKKGNKWVAQMSWLGKNMYLGIYDSEKEAHAAFCGAVAVTRDPRFTQLTHVRT